MHFAQLCYTACKTPRESDKQLQTSQSHASTVTCRDHAQSLTQRTHIYRHFGSERDVCKLFAGCVLHCVLACTRIAAWRQFGREQSCGHKQQQQRTDRPNNAKACKQQEACWPASKQLSQKWGGHQTQHCATARGSIDGGNGLAPVGWGHPPAKGPNKDG